MREDAASAVVAATLVFALGVMMFIIFSSTQVPIWIEDREQSHALTVKEEFAGFQADLAQLAATDVGIPQLLEVPLAPEPIAFLQTGRATGQLSVLDDLAVDLQMTNAQLYANGATLSAAADGALSNWADVASVQGLSLAMTATTAANGESAAQVRFDDGTNAITATFAHVGPDVGPCAGYALVARLDAPAIENAIVCGVSGSGTFSVNLLDELPISEALSNLERPFSVTFTQNASSTLGGGIWFNSDGIPQRVGTAPAGPTSYAEDLGVIAFLPSYVDAIREDVRLEGGSLVVEQAAGSVMTNPTVSLATDGQAGLLEATFLDLTGSGSVSGDGSATIKITPSAVRSFLYHVDDWTLTATGTTAWGKHFADELYLSTVVGTSTEGDTSVLDVDPLPDGWWISLKVVEAKVELL